MTNRSELAASLLLVDDIVLHLGEGNGGEGGAAGGGNGRCVGGGGPGGVMGSFCSDSFPEIWCRLCGQTSLDRVICLQYQRCCCLQKSYTDRCDVKFASASRVFPKHRLTLLSPLLLSFRSFIVTATAGVITVVSLSLAVVFRSRSVGLLKTIHRFHANNVNRVRSCVNIVTRR